LTSLLVVLLTMLAMTLLPQRACAARYDTSNSNMPTFESGTNVYKWSVYTTSLGQSTGYTYQWTITPVAPINDQQQTDVFSVYSGEYERYAELHGSATLTLQGPANNTRKIHKVAISGLQAADGKSETISGTITVTLKNQNGGTVATFTQDSRPAYYNCYNLTEPVVWNANNYVEISFSGCEVKFDQLNVIDGEELNASDFSWPTEIREASGAPLDNPALSTENGTTLTYTGASGSFPFALQCPNDYTSGVLYESSAPIASIPESGEVSVYAFGTTTITATVGGNDDYLPLSFSYTLNVVPAAGTYNLFVADVQVTSENCDNILGNNYSGLLSYDAENNILTMSGVDIPFGIVSGYTDLTVMVSGTNYISSESGCPISYSGQTTGGTLTFIKDDECNEVCSLKLVNSDYNSQVCTAISGFSAVAYEGMSLAAAYGTEYSERGYLYNSTISSDVEYVYDATITSADVYQLWYNSEQVTSENAATLEKSYDDNSVTASFDGKTSTLTFNNLGGGYGGHAVISNMENLNVYLIGENSMSGESQSFFYTPSQSAKINFQTSDDAPGSLTMYSMDVPFEGFVEANIIYENDLKYTLTPQYSADDLSVVENYTATIQVPPYGLIVYTEDQPNGVQVTKENRTNVLGEDKPTVQFDGRNRLVLNGATLTKILLSDSQFLPFVDEGKKLRGMEIYLEGESTIENSELVAIQGDATTMTKLTFLTGGNAPGSLTYNYTGAAAALTEDTNIFTDFDVEYKDNLTKMLASNTQAVVKCPLQLIVDNIGVPATVSYNDASYNIALNDDIVDKVLYTLDDDGTKYSSDGNDNGTIVINSVMTDEQVRISDGFEPGTPGYAANFKGLTFIVPAGSGVITLKNVVTKSGFAFHVKVGQQEPAEVVNTNSDEPQKPADIEVPFSCSAASYVKIYLVNRSASGAPGYDGHRAGPKATISGGIGGMKVESSSIAVVPEPAAPYHKMAAGDYTPAADGSKYGIKVTNADVTDLPDNAFATASPAPAYSGNRAPAGDISYIDLSETKITGKVYNRASGAFAGVPENTVIYLPAGNMAVGPNFVIGGVCDDMQLDASTEEAFELSKDFTAAKATFDRSFTKGEDAHGNGKCYTVYLPYAVNIAKTGGDFFTCGEYNAATGTINMTKVTAPNLEANTAYIYKPATTGTMSPMTSVKVVKPTAAAAAPESASEATGLHGVYEYHQWTSEPGNVYCFAAVDATAENGKPIKAGQFVKVGAGTHIKPFRAYLRINVPAGGSAPEYVAVDWGNGTTSIVPLDKTQVSQDADGWYTITGFRLPAKPTEKGIYIHNNKKTIVK